jgi:hypothetical protein
MPTTLTPPADWHQQPTPTPVNGHQLTSPDSLAWSEEAHRAAPQADAPTSKKDERKDSRPPFMLTVIALLGAGLSFNAVRLFAEPFAGFYGGIATACLFDAGMWLSSRWYIRTVRGGRPLRPALWFSLALVAVTLLVNIAPAHTIPEGIVHGIGPGLFAAFTWLEAALVLREYRKTAAVRDRVPFGYAVAHPVRALQVTVMMLGSGQKRFTNAKAMCQNREAQRRSWKAQYRPRWVVFLIRTLRPGWRGKVDPVLYTAYRWGAFDTSALILPSLGMDTRPGAAHAMAAVSATTTLADPATPVPSGFGQDTGQVSADRWADAIERTLTPAAGPVAAARVGGASRQRRIQPNRRAYRQVTGPISGQAPATGRPSRKPGTGQDPAKRPERKPGSVTEVGRKVAAVAAKNPAWKPPQVAAALGIGERTARRHMTGR